MSSAVIYARISDDKTGEGLGVARQEADAHQLADQRGWPVLEVITDNDISAAGRKARPGFERVLSLVESGAVQVVVAWALDRLTRNRRDTVRLIEACQLRGATIALVRGSDLDLSTPAGRLTADLLAAVARSEIEVKADRQTRAAQQAAEQGRWRGGRRPFGYEADGMTIRECEAAAIRTAYQQLLDGVSLRQIAKQWNDAGLIPPQAAKSGWVGTTVTRCLRKPRYAGLSAYKLEALGEAQWPALVDADTWHAAQALMRDPSRVPTRGNQKRLTGVARCGVCGGPVHAGGGATGRGVYRCASTQGHVIRKREPVDEFIRAVVVERLSRPDAAALAAPPVDRPDTAGLLREADELRQRLDGLAAGYAEGALTLSQLRAGSKRIQDKLAGLDEQLAAADQRRHVADLRQVVGAEDVAAAWDRLTIEAQRQLIDALMIIRLMPPGRGVTTVKPEHVVIEWH